MTDRTYWWHATLIPWSQQHMMMALRKHLTARHPWETQEITKAPWDKRAVFYGAILGIRLLRSTHGEPRQFSREKPGTWQLQGTEVS